MVTGWVILVVIDAHHDGDVFIGCWRGDDDLLGTCGDVLLGIGSLSKETG